MLRKMNLHLNCQGLSTFTLSLVCRAVLLKTSFIILPANLITEFYLH